MYTLLVISLLHIFYSVTVQCNSTTDRKFIYVTIDDGPSRNTNKIVEYLKKYSIPAIFYCRGDGIEKYQNNLINAIQNDFLIGNHSYSHPYFSKIPIETCFTEILKTEELINTCYDLAGKKRKIKVVRLPFGDRGAGPLVTISSKDNENERLTQIQLFLRQQGFEKVNFAELEDNAIDSLWSFDTLDYKKEFFKNEGAFLDNLEQSFAKLKQQTIVLLMHDLNFNYNLFEITMEFLRNHDVVFVYPF